MYYVVAVLSGLLIGSIFGAWFHSKYLDKPETENNFNADLKIRQKKGRFNNLFKK